MTLTSEDANSKLAQAVTVAYVDAEKRVAGCLVQIWKLIFGHKVKHFCSDFQHKVWQHIAVQYVFLIWVVKYSTG